MAKTGGRARGMTARVVVLDVGLLKATLITENSISEEAKGEQLLRGSLQAHTMVRWVRRT